MNNADNTEQRVHAMHRPGAQQAVEEAYLNDLLNTGAASEVPVASRTTSEEAIQPQPPQAVAQPVAMQHQPDTTKKNNAAGRVQVPFACQVIDLAGLKLAIPMASFTRVLSWPDKLLPVVKSSGWILGQMQYGQLMLDIIDLAGLIYNKRQPQDDLATRKYSYNSVVLLQDGKIGLPCDRVNDMVMIDPDEVCWRSADSQRRWLAGTIKRQGIALLDINEIIQLSGS